MPTCLTYLAHGSAFRLVSEEELERAEARGGFGPGLDRHTPQYPERLADSLLTMSGATSRLRSLLGQLGGATKPSSSPVGWDHTHHVHQLSPTQFLERAAAIEPDATAVVHQPAASASASPSQQQEQQQQQQQPPPLLRRSYAELADRARGLAYHLLAASRRRVGILAPNTPAFLESIYAIVAAGGVVVPVNYR